MLRMAHVAPMSGHFFRKKTEARFREVLYWAGVTKNVKDTCKRCPVCQMAATVTKHRAPLLFLPIITPFSQIGMDIADPLPWTPCGHNYALITTVDYAWKWPEAISYMVTDSEAVVYALLQFLMTVGLTNEVRMDP